LKIRQAADTQSAPQPWMSARESERFLTEKKSA